MTSKVKLFEGMELKRSHRSGRSNRKEKGQRELNRVVQKNIRAILEYQRKTIEKRTTSERIADTITALSGRMLFAFLHVVWFSVWLVWNTGWFGLKPFDPFPYGMLTMIVSLEAIFLSTFMLITQNRMSKQDRQRADLDLQINLLTEREITLVLRMLHDIQDQMGIETKSSSELAELQRETKPEEILVEIEREEGELGNSSSNPA